MITSGYEVYELQATSIENVDRPVDFAGIPSGFSSIKSVVRMENGLNKIQLICLWAKT